MSNDKHLGEQTSGLHTRGVGMTDTIVILPPALAQALAEEMAGFGLPGLAPPPQGYEVQADLPRADRAGLDGPGLAGLAFAAGFGRALASAARPAIENGRPIPPGAPVGSIQVGATPGAPLFAPAAGPQSHPPLPSETPAEKCPSFTNLNSPGAPSARDQNECSGNVSWGPRPQGPQAAEYGFIAGCQSLIARGKEALSLLRETSDLGRPDGVPVLNWVSGLIEERNAAWDDMASAVAAADELTSRLGHADRLIAQQAKFIQVYRDAVNVTASNRDEEADLITRLRQELADCRTHITKMSVQAGKYTTAIFSRDRTIADLTEKLEEAELTGAANMANTAEIIKRRDQLNADCDRLQQRIQDDARRIEELTKTCAERGVKIERLEAELRIARNQATVARNQASVSELLNGTDYRSAWQGAVADAERWRKQVDEQAKQIGELMEEASKHHEWRAHLQAKLIRAEAHIAATWRAVQPCGLDLAAIKIQEAWERSAYQGDAVTGAHIKAWRAAEAALLARVPRWEA